MRETPTPSAATAEPPPARETARLLHDLQRRLGELEQENTELRAALHAPADDALRESHARFDQLAAQNRTIVWEVDADGLFIYVSRVVQEVLGYHPDELTGCRHFYDLHPTAGREAFKQAAFEVFARKEPFVNPVNAAQHKNGPVVWLSTNGAPCLHDDGTLRGYRGADTDITERKHAETALHESEQRLKFAMEGANDGIWDVDMRTNTVSLSPRGCDMLGYQPTEFQSTVASWMLMVHPDDLPATQTALNEHLSGHAPFFQIEQRLKHKSGHYLWILARGKVSERDDAGRPLRMTGTHTDITERRLIESHLQQAQKMDSVGRLAGGVAHDFNNMLGVIMGHAELLMEKVEPASPLFADLQEIQRAAERSANLTRQLLTFARKQTINPQVLDLNATVNGRLKLLQRLIGENLELTWRPGDALWPVKVDLSQLEQVLVNLCVNARDAITGKGQVSIETRNHPVGQANDGALVDAITGDYVMLEIRDDGCGMAPETRCHLFEPFFTTKEQGKGTGLGLATVYGIVKQNHGFITVSSAPGQGTTFSLCLPRYQPPPAGNRQPAPAASAG